MRVGTRVRIAGPVPWYEDLVGYFGTVVEEPPVEEQIFEVPEGYARLYIKATDEYVYFPEEALEVLS